MVPKLYGVIKVVNLAEGSVTGICQNRLLGFNVAKCLLSLITLLQMEE